MKIVNAMTASDSPNPHGVSARELLSTENAQVVMVTLQPGEALKLHITPSMPSSTRLRVRASSRSVVSDRP